MGNLFQGKQAKVALVAAFASDAELYILDEPTSGLDPLMEKVFQECIKEVKAEGKSVLLALKNWLPRVRPKQWLKLWRTRQID